MPPLVKKVKKLDDYVYYKSDCGRVVIYKGDCREVMRLMDAESVSSVVSDPPYGLSSGGDSGFMGHKWDAQVPGTQYWQEVLRVCKPGAYLLAFGGTRTFHRLACYIEDVGFELRDVIGYLFGSGFPKSHDVAKAVDRLYGVERDKIRHKPRPETSGTMAGSTDTRPWIEESRVNGYHEVDGNTPATEDALRWQGWGTSLKPAWEPVIVSRKPLTGTVAQNVLEHGTGAINVDGCRVGTEGGTQKVNLEKGDVNGERAGQVLGKNISFKCDIGDIGKGRWPANIIHDGSEEVLAVFPETGPSKKAVMGKGGDDKGNTVYGKYGDIVSALGHDDNGGSASRFFYTAKSDEKDRGDHNTHPTVKPVDLMQYLVRLVTPKDHTVLDPFMGSGSTGVATLAEGCKFIGIEQDEKYCGIAVGRIRNKLIELGHAKASAPPVKVLTLGRKVT